jgi:hypothetical protein
LVGSRSVTKNGDCGNEISRFGSISLSRSLVRAGLVDRFRVVMFPVIAGATGKERIYDGYPDYARPASPPAEAVTGLAYRRTVQFGSEDARRYVASVTWRFAKTMPQWPHEYTVRAWRPDLEQGFCAFASLIRTQGVVKPWPRDAARPRYRHPYLELDGWQYWTMSPDIEEVAVINRARPDDEEYRP